MATTHVMMTDMVVIPKCLWLLENREHDAHDDSNCGDSNSNTLSLLTVVMIALINPSLTIRNMHEMFQSTTSACGNN